MIRASSLGERISDVAVLTRDLDRSIEFYRDRLGFELQHRMPGFADFASPHVRLALWADAHFAENVGFEPSPAGDATGRLVMIAVHLPSPEDVDACFADLVARGVEVAKAPTAYPAWNAYALYFTGPDSEVWELYAWFEGGEPGRL